jgi:iron complex transport system substrate-binding protein
VDPPICGGHWNPELVELAGGTDGLGEAGRPSRTVAWEEVLAWRPEVMVLACCGFTADRTRREVSRLRQRPGFAGLPCTRTGRIYVLDGVGHFSRPGPSLVDSLEALAAILN